MSVPMTVSVIPCMQWQIQTGGAQYRVAEGTVSTWSCLTATT
jgi:hypothetical protein